MTQSGTSRQEAVGTDDRIEGPFAGLDKYGRVDYEFYRCRRCGAEAVNKRDLYGCCRE